MIDVLINLLMRFGCQTVAKMDAKSDQKALQNQSTSRPRSYLFFCRIWDRFCIMCQRLDL